MILKGFCELLALVDGNYCSLLDLPHKAPVLWNFDSVLCFQAKQTVAQIVNLAVIWAAMMLMWHPSNVENQFCFWNVKIPGLPMSISNHYLWFPIQFYGKNNQGY